MRDGDADTVIRANTNMLILADFDIDFKNFMVQSIQQARFLYMELCGG